MSPRASSAGISGGPAFTLCTACGSMPNFASSLDDAKSLTEPATMPSRLMSPTPLMPLRTTSLMNVPDCENTASALMSPRVERLSAEASVVPANWLWPASTLSSASVPCEYWTTRTSRPPRANSFSPSARKNGEYAGSTPTAKRISSAWAAAGGRSRSAPKHAKRNTRPSMINHFPIGDENRAASGRTWLHVHRGQTMTS